MYVLVIPFWIHVLDSGHGCVIDMTQLSHPVLFRILQVLRAIASGAGEHGVHETADSQLFAQHLPKTLSRRWQNTKRYVRALLEGKVGDCPP